MVDAVAATLLAAGDHGGHGGHQSADLPPWTLERLLAWSPDAFFLVLCGALLAVYLAAVLRLRRRGDRWPVGRTISWTVGQLLVVFTMNTGMNDYGMVMFSVHMVQHMVLSMIAPIFLVLGAPTTLALRALRPAPRGRRGPREVLLAVLHSRYAAVLTAAPVTIAFFILNLYGLYLTPVFDWMMASYWGHVLMMAHFVAVGYVFFWPIIGIDPGPRRSGYLMRMLELFMGMPFHAFFGIAVMMGSTLIVDSFASPPASLGIDPLADQTAGGGIAWAFSEVPSVIVLLALLVQWRRAEDRQARRKDRAADRDGDAELAAYNAYLASLAARDQAVSR
ncbi:cytochrome c oxidase assembly protein [Allostreptomyces psammosilenae]|uniref:Cytochrome c oxidase assembly factor CtaG n=1 Tax=Allostreptomyces psammosilenae TaxID=1892865 RepID=A0A852ZPM6_9ACTN|nr:cytochrome c oxidase assembly protein [Allostreptomyces psammosilenae]NYI04319.1 cytochrome c oxidase assembly factor CtaG [Allostreptomyces psammosilenae]